LLISGLMLAPENRRCTINRSISATTSCSVRPCP